MKNKERYVQLKNSVYSFVIDSYDLSIPEQEALGLEHIEDSVELEVFGEVYYDTPDTEPTITPGMIIRGRHTLQVEVPAMVAATIRLKFYEKLEAFA